MRGMESAPQAPHRRQSFVDRGATAGTMEKLGGLES